MQVKELMCANPACCMPATSLRDAAVLMCQHDCGALPVMDPDDPKKPIGVITDRDIVCRAVAQGCGPDETPVSECMSQPVATMGPNSTTESCCAAMEAAKVRRMLVVDDDGNLCGIVAQADVALRLDPEDAAEVVREVSEPTREASLAW